MNVWGGKGATAWELQIRGYQVRWVHLKGGLWTGGFGWLHPRRWSFNYHHDWDTPCLTKN